MFWIFAAVLTVAAIAAVVVPLVRKKQQLDSSDSYDLEVYKAQLSEIDRDFSQGLIAESEAEAAKTEVARRILNAQAAIEFEAASDENRGKSTPRKAKSSGTYSTNTKIAVVVVAMVVPFVSLGLYTVLGSPNLPAQSLSSRLNKPPEQQSLTELVASAELRLKNNPEDLVGWKKLAPIYLSMRRPDQAIQAYSNVLRLEGESASSLGDLGEAIVVRDSGVVSDQALKIFERANELAPKEPKPRFFLAIRLGQQGKHQEAIDAWQAIIDDSSADAPWVPFAKNQMAAITKKLDETNGTVTDGQQASEPGPTQEDVAAAAEMSAEDRQQMIENMVTQLAERLDEEGGSVDEWVRLIRAEVVLKRPDMAAKTVTKAMDALQSDVDGLEKIKAAARSLGVSINQ